MAELEEPINFNKRQETLENNQKPQPSITMTEVRRS